MSTVLGDSWDESKVLCYHNFAFLSLFSLLQPPQLMFPMLEITFSYYEVTNLGSGTGDYAGYTEQATYNGIEMMTGVSVDGIVSANYSYYIFLE